MSKRSLTSVLAGTLLCAACASSEPWTFAASRGVYNADGMESLAKSDPDPGSACALALILVLPFAFDLVALPVTFPHDLYVHGWPG